MEGKGLDLQKLSEKVDNALAKETEESLYEFLNEPFPPLKPWNPVQPTPLKGWVNVYYRPAEERYSLGEIRDTKDECNSVSISKRVAIIDLGKHYEGEGL